MDFLLKASNWSSQMNVELVFIGGATRAEEDAAAFISNRRTEPLGRLDLGLESSHPRLCLHKRLRR